MTLVRRIARPLLAANFVISGLDAYRHPAGRAKLAAPFIEKVAPALGLPNDPELLVRANAATMVAAGSLFALGRLPRLSAVALAGALVPTTIAGHPFWQEQDPADKAKQRLQFLKNVGILGGLLLATVDTEGRPGLAWRAGRAAKDVKRSAELTGRDAARLAGAARREARHAAKAARREARLAAVTAHDKLT
ncbi:MAG TPA: DoxX family protein [Dermatophilaceae bacterium]|nr:DoxX family protein [Dermatophilaceae bacterium]